MRNNTTSCLTGRRGQGCTEFGSDTTIENTVSAAAHHALGFTETERARCLRKSLEEPR